jgi:thiosulfate dehydrogenase [quinone] large subunit
MPNPGRGDGPAGRRHAKLAPVTDGQRSEGHGARGAAGTPPRPAAAGADQTGRTGQAARPGQPDRSVLPRGAGALFAAVRVGVALLWIQNAGWKDPPTFGAPPNPGGLYRFTRYAVDHEVFAPYAWLVKTVVLPNFTFFGWMTLLVEASLGAFLLAGLLTRFWALVGIAQTSAITLSVLHAPDEWHWSYFLMFFVHIMLFAVAAGRWYGLDGLWRPAWRRPGGRLGRLAPILVRLS